MILPKSSDLLHTGFCPQTKLRVVFVEVSDSARALEQNHLCGPAAGLALAEALAGVALLSADLHAPDETVLLRFQVPGPIQGFLAEAAGDGGLRGYTQVKVMNALDGCAEIDLDEAFGDRGEVQVMHSAPGRLISRAAFSVSPVSAHAAVEEYYVRSLQRPAAAQIAVLTYGGYIDLARGVLVECMPDGDRAAFEQVVHLVADGTALEALETSVSVQEWCETLGLGEVHMEPPRPLAFRCRCTRERVEAVIGALTVPELQELLQQERAAQVHCHMCGKGYDVSLERLAALIAEKQKKEGP